MTRLSSTHLKTFLLIAGIGLYSGAVNAVPAIWEAQLGATVTDTTPAPALPALPALDKKDDATISLSFGSMKFPLYGTTYTGTDVLNISSNGFISLGGSNGSDATASGSILTMDPFPRIAPYWIDLDPENQGGDIYYNTFNDDNDPNIDRIVITFSTGFNECSDIGSVCFVHAQVQLLEDGTIIFGYNGIGMTASVTSDLLVGISPGGMTADPGSINIIAASKVPFDSGMEPTIYELFAPAFPTSEDLKDLNFVFTPNGSGGFILSDGIINPPDSTEPPTWESAIGTTILAPLLGVPALDDVDDGTINITFGLMSFPFAGTTYTGLDILNISSNGFISLGGDNGADCCSGDPIKLTSDPFPRIAPFWTDLDPGEEGGDIYIKYFDEAVDRLVITFVTGYDDCEADECRALVQVQLLENGTIRFGYNGIDLTNGANDADDDVLVGISPANGASDPGSTDISNTAPFHSDTDTIYELFVAASAPPFDLDGGNVIFTPDGAGGFNVTAPGVSGSAVGGVTPGRNSNKHHCSLGGSDAALDPTLWLLVLVSCIYLGYRRSYTPQESHSRGIH